MKDVFNIFDFLSLNNNIIYILKNNHYIHENDQVIFLDERDFCSPNPCLNGGSCSSNFNVDPSRPVTCSCRPGYRGVYCHLSSCLSQPCLNGGTCTPNSYSYTCECPAGYRQPNCQGMQNDFQNCLQSLRWICPKAEWVANLQTFSYQKVFLSVKYPLHEQQTEFLAIFC